MATKLYVGNLPANVSQDDIRTLFTQAGEVGKIILTRDRHDLTPRGSAFVDMTTDAGRLEAIKRFNGYTIGEKILIVRQARFRPNKLRSGRTGKNVGNDCDTV